MWVHTTTNGNTPDNTHVHNKHIPRLDTALDIPQQRHEIWRHQRCDQVRIVRLRPCGGAVTIRFLRLVLLRIALCSVQGAVAVEPVGDYVQACAHHECVLVAIEVPHSEGDHVMLTHCLG